MKWIAPFPIGLALLGLWLVESVVRYRRDVALPFGTAAVPAVALLAALAAVWFNPQHFGIIGYVRELGAHPVVQRLPEWAPVWPPVLKDSMAFLVVLAASVVMLVWARKRVAIFHVLTFVVFAALAWQTGRAIVWFGLVLGPIVGEILGRGEREGEEAGRGLVGDNGCRQGCRRTYGSAESAEDRVMVPVMAILLLGLMVVTLPWVKGHLPLPPQKAALISLETPVRSTEWLLEHRPPGRLFHHMSYGSYLIWAGGGRYQVFVDPRIELYSPEIWAEYETLSRGEAGWEGLVKKWGIKTMMLDVAQQNGLVKVAKASGKWVEVARFGGTVLMERERKGWGG